MRGIFAGDIAIAVTGKRTPFYPLSYGFGRAGDLERKPELEPMRWLKMLM
jgi:hypothetical protein